MASIHDETFKTLMDSKPFLVAFFKQYLPVETAKNIDWASAKIFKLSGEHIREVFPFDGGEAIMIAKDIADLACIVDQKKGGKALITLHAEHLSTPSKLMPLRLGLYILGALYEYAKINKTDKLPEVYSIIYYHGKKTPYPYAKNLSEMFEAKYPFYELFHPTFVDLGQIPDEELLKRKTLSAAEIVFKHIFDKNLESHVKVIAESIHHTDDNTRHHVLNYLLRIGEAKDSTVFVKKLQQALKDEEKEIMTIADGLKQQGVLEVAQNMVKMGLDKETIKKATNLSDAELKKVVH